MWLDLWAHALIDLGLSDERFYSLQPCQMDALSRQYRRKIEGPDFQAAQIASCVVNFSTVHPKKRVDPRDLMMYPPAKSLKPEVSRRRSRAAIAAEFRASMARVMGS